jgi:hypothetical protein
MGLVLTGEHGLRFWVEGGRPIWLYSPDAKGATMRGPGAIVPPERIQEAGRADPVGEQTEGEKPRKAFLFVDPYRWEFRLGGGEEGYDPRYDDEATVLPIIFSKVRDYKCEPGKRCPCPDEECVQHVANTWSGGCDPHEDGCRMVRNVTLEHFKSWKDYDAIHLSSHGSEFCDEEGANCAAGIASGLIISGSLREMVRRDPGITAGNWRTEPGVELVGPLGRPLHHCSVPHPETAEEIPVLEEGTTAYQDADCNLPPEETLWREYVGVDFFKTYYRPGDLEDKLIFLNSCVSMAHRVLARYLAGPAERNAVIGWEEWTANGAASRAAAVFYREWVKGKTAREAFDKVASDPEFQALGPAFEGAEAVVRGDDPDRPAVAGPAIFRREGSEGKRGIETVFLLDPDTEARLEDGDVLPLFTRPGDGAPDTLDTLIEVVGVDPESENPADYVLKASLKGRSPTDSASLQFATDEEGTYRFRGVLGLGVDLEPDEPVDLEVWADLPGGGETRWLYEELRPDVCIVPVQGEYEGRLGGSLARSIEPGARGHFAKILDSPLGGWTLQMESRDPGRYLSLSPNFSGPPEVGRTVEVHDGGYTDASIGGRADGEKGRETVNWKSGTVRIRFTAVEEQPGKDFLWVCGEITADLVGVKDPPPGGVYPVEVPATFEGRFRAEWHAEGQ